MQAAHARDLMVFLDVVYNHFGPGAETPFLYFCDFGQELADKVREGRRQEFSRFPRFADPAVRRSIPDPNGLDTYQRSCLNWQEADRPEGREFLQLYRSLLDLRKKEIIPRLAGLQAGKARYTVIGAAGLHVQWRLADEAELEVFVNFSAKALAGVALDDQPLLYALPAMDREETRRRTLRPHSIAWFLKK